MLDLLPLLLGTRGYASFRLLLGVISVVSLATSAFVVVNINGEPNKIVHGASIGFAIFLLASIATELFLPSNTVFARSRLNLPRVLLIGLTGFALILGMSEYGAIIYFVWGVIIGLIFIVNSIIFVLLSVLIRPQRWKLQVLKGFVFLCLGIFFMLAFIHDYEKPRLFLSILLLVFSISCFRVVLRRGRLTNAAVPAFTKASVSIDDDGPLIGDEGHPVPIKIRIWLTENEQIVPYSYIAELWNFFTSALSPRRAEFGPTAHHASLECGPDVYVSFCPKSDLAHLDPNKSSVSNMKRAIRMDQHYRMPARWRSSYKDDLDLRGEPTHTVFIKDYSYQRLLHYQKYAHKLLTYHVTRQNCCTTVVDAVEMAIFGRLSSYQMNASLLAKLVVNDLFWQAASIRFRARSFAWTTTGLLKYSQAISVLLQLSATVK